MADRPTEKANMSFEFAKNSANNFKLNKTIPADQQFMFTCLAKLAEGLQQMNTGLRATYILLEEVKAQLDRQNAGIGKPKI
jgi:hypothetical protein